MSWERSRQDEDAIATTREAPRTEVVTVIDLANRLATTRAAIRHQTEQIERAKATIDKLDQELAATRRDLWAALHDLDPGLRGAIAEQEPMTKRSEW